MFSSTTRKRRPADRRPQRRTGFAQPGPRPKRDAGRKPENALRFGHPCAGSLLSRLGPDQHRRNIGVGLPLALRDGSEDPTVDSDWISRLRAEFNLIGDDEVRSRLDELAAASDGTIVIRPLPEQPATRGQLRPAFPGVFLPQISWPHRSHRVPDELLRSGVGCRRRRTGL